MHDDICYKKPFLKEVVARIDFVAPIDTLTNSLPPKLATAASTKFPISEPTDGFSQEFHLAPGAIHHRHSSFKEWRFFGKSREKQVCITATFIFISISSYTSYESLRDDWKSLVLSFSDAFPDARVGRFGLRYINNIEVSDAGIDAWSAYINQDLVAPAAFFKDYTVTRLFHVAGLKFGELDMTFQFGLPNPDFPSIMKRPLFVLDLDCYVGTSHDFSESISNMDNAHACIQNVFEASITDALRSLMNVPTSTVQR